MFMTRENQVLEHTFFSEGCCNMKENKQIEGERSHGRGGKWAMHSILAGVAFSDFSVSLPFPLFYEEYLVCFSSVVVFFYLVTTSWISDISLCEKSVK